MKINQLVDYTRQILQPERFKDYCPNGLQVEGRVEVHKIVTGVTASMALLERAQMAGADAILVHHGYFWRNEDARVVGMKKHRLKFLLDHEINLLAYHLPLDVHPELGNNIQLAKVLGLVHDGWAGEQNLIACGHLPATLSLQRFAQQIQSGLNREPMVIGSLEANISRVAWCTGAAQSYIEQAVELGVDAFISGEISEPTVHAAKESGVAYIAAGHHATERYGIKALGEYLAANYGLDHEFIDIDNPI